MTDVARRAGVSHATVSRIINGRSGVSSETEDRVRKAIAELQYLAPPITQRPGKTARIERRSKCHHVALLTFDQALTEHSAFVASIYEGARRAAAEHGVAVSLLSLDHFDTVPEWITPKNLDGLLLHGLRSRGHLTRTAAEIPSLWLTTHEDEGVDSVLPGNRQVGTIAARYLADRGHSIVAALSPETENPSYQVRIKAFLDEAGKNGTKASRCKLTQRERSSTLDEEGKIRALIRKLADAKKSLRPTGIFVPSDKMASLAYAACRREGLEPGQDFEFISCDNETAYLIGLFPRPATIDLGTEARGRMAFELLLSRIQDPSLDRKATLILDPVLVPSPDDSPTSHRRFQP